ncbi:MAG: hypothetical protein HRT88_00105 [Lentisphaeraceae bacterium]|nr:hypothetical protein [Lentisphaeraceae bacterium]
MVLIGDITAVLTAVQSLASLQKSLLISLNPLSAWQSLSSFSIPDPIEEVVLDGYVPSPYALLEADFEDDHE